jgi:hypothetical protein
VTAPTNSIEVTYTNHTNMDAGFGGVYEPGQRLVRGYTGTLVVDDPLAIEAIAERIFRLHNRDGRPDGSLCPSMSVGDVIVIGETAISCDRFGWKLVRVDAADIISDRSWAHVPYR